MSIDMTAAESPEGVLGVLTSARDEALLLAQSLDQEARERERQAAVEVANLRKRANHLRGIGAEYGACITGLEKAQERQRDLRRQGLKPPAA